MSRSRFFADFVQKARTTSQAGGTLSSTTASDAAPNGLRAFRGRAAGLSVLTHRTAAASAGSRTPTPTASEFGAQALPSNAPRSRRPSINLRIAVTPDGTAIASPSDDVHKASNASDYRDVALDSPPLSPSLRAGLTSPVPFMPGAFRTQSRAGYTTPPASAGFNSNMLGLERGLLAARDQKARFVASKLLVRGGGGRKRTRVCYGLGGPYVRSGLSNVITAEC